MSNNLSKEEKIAIKEEKKRIAQINSSLEYFNADTQNKLNALAVGKSDNVFYCGNNIYKKIYMLKPFVLKENKALFLKTLVQLFTNRIRLSMNIKNYDNKINGSMFMTVFFEHETYFEALEEIKEFESQMQDKVCRVFGVSIKECSLEQLLSYIYMNVSGDYKNINPDFLFGKKNKFDLFESFNNKGAGYFETPNKYGVTLIGKYFPSEGKDFNDFLKFNEGNYQVIFDFQAISDEDKELFRMLLEGKYNKKLEPLSEEDVFINLTYFIVVQAKSEECIKQINKEAFRFFDSNNIVIMPGMNRERDLFVSSCTLGISDFHTMQNTKLNIAANLLL